MEGPVSVLHISQILHQTPRRLVPPQSLPQGVLHQDPDSELPPPLSTWSSSPDLDWGVAGDTPGLFRRPRTVSDDTRRGSGCPLRWGEPTTETSVGRVMSCRGETVGDTHTFRSPSAVGVGVSTSTPSGSRRQKTGWIPDVNEGSSTGAPEQRRIVVGDTWTRKSWGKPNKIRSDS